MIQPPISKEGTLGCSIRLILKVIIKFCVAIIIFFTLSLVFFANVFNVRFINKTEGNPKKTSN